jgi:radial spoke head protein 9
LLILQNAEKFAAVSLWGRLYGTTRDYFIAQGTNAPIGGKKFFYSMDGITWAKLLDVHPVIAASCQRITARLVGDPSNEYTVSEKEDDKDAPLGLPEEVAALRTAETKEGRQRMVTTVITEEQRLSAIVNKIDNDCALVPRGALRKTDVGVEVNPTFSGLSLADAGLLHNYLKLRTPAYPKSNLSKAQEDPAIDFLDKVSADEPQGTWSLQFHRGCKSAVVRSLGWPGFSAYLIPESKTFDYFYFGTGLRNQDLAFMLP